MSVNISGHQCEVDKVYHKRAMLRCPFHVSQKGGYDLDITLEGPFAGMGHCWGCGKNGRITDQELAKLRSMRTNKEEKTGTEDWDQLNKKYILQRFQSGVYPPLEVRMPIHALLEWGWDGQAHTFPERNEKDEIIGILRRFPDRNKGVVSGSKRGLTIPRINFDPSKTLYITEGLSDLSVILECSLQGIARPTASTGNEMVSNWLCLHYSQHGLISVIADNDKAGIEGATNLCAALNRIPFEDKQEKAFSVGWKTFSTDFGNDLYDMYRAVGKERTKECLLN